MVWRDPSSAAKLLFSGTRDGERGGERGGDPYGERSGERGDERGANALIGVFPKTRVTRSDVVATSDVVAGVAVGTAEGDWARDDVLCGVNGGTPVLARARTERGL